MCSLIISTQLHSLINGQSAKWLGPKSLKSYNSPAYTVPRHRFITLITAAYFCGCFSTSYFARAYLWWWTVHKFWYSCLNVLVQVVLFSTNKTILWKQWATWLVVCFYVHGCWGWRCCSSSCQVYRLLGRYRLCWVWADMLFMRSAQEYKQQQSN